MQAKIAEDASVTRDLAGGMTMVLGSPRVAELRYTLNRALNTWPEAPPWLFKLSDELDRLYG